MIPEISILPVSTHPQNTDVITSKKFAKRYIILALSKTLRTILRMHLHIFQALHFVHPLPYQVSSAWTSNRRPQRPLPCRILRMPGCLFSRCIIFRRIISTLAWTRACSRLAYVPGVRAFMALQIRKLLLKCTSISWIIYYDKLNLKCVYPFSASLTNAVTMLEWFLYQQHNWGIQGNLFFVVGLCPIAHLSLQAPILAQ